MIYNVYIWCNDNEFYFENWIYSVIVIMLNINVVGYKLVFFEKLCIILFSFVEK